jgi:hypothetical protein
MNRILIAVFSIESLCGSLMAQSTQPSNSMPPDTESPSTAQPAPAQPAAPATSTPANPASAPASGAPRIAPGSVLPVQLTRSIDAKRAKRGDEVVAKVTQDMRNNAGAVIVAKDTKVIGHVTQAQARSKEQKESELAIAFNQAVPKDGKPMQMPMSIQAIIAPLNRNPANANGSDQPQSTGPATETGGGSPVPGGRSGSTGGTTSGSASMPQAPSGTPSDTPAQTQARPPITGNTQGVVGIANLKLSAAPNATEGSVVTSEKNNVKLDDGTLLLLRVNQ